MKRSRRGRKGWRRGTNKVGEAGVEQWGSGEWEWRREFQVCATTTRNSQLKVLLGLSLDFLPGSSVHQAG